MDFRAPHIVRRHEFDIVGQRPTQIVGAQAGLVAVSESFPTSLTDRFLGRAFAPERAVLEPSRNEPGAR